MSKIKDKEHTVVHPEARRTVSVPCRPPPSRAWPSARAIPSTAAALRPFARPPSVNSVPGHLCVPIVWHPPPMALEVRCLSAAMMCARGPRLCRCSSVINPPSKNKILLLLELLLSPVASSYYNTSPGISPTCGHFGREDFDEVIHGVSHHLTKLFLAS